MHDDIFISQERYSNDILKRLRMYVSKPTPKPIAIGLKLRKEDCNNSVFPTRYKSLVRSLMYLTITRPDIMHAVSPISRFMENLKDTHWQVGKRILRHVNDTKGYGIMYNVVSDFRLISYIDSD